MLHQPQIIADPNDTWEEPENSTNDIVFVVQDYSSMYAVKACLELLKHANRFSSENRYRFQVVRRIESAFVVRSQSSRRTVVLFGGLKRPWKLNESSTRLLRTHLPCSDRIAVVGSAVLFASEIPCLRHCNLCVHAKFSEAADEKNIKAIEHDLPVFRDGKVHSSTGELAALHMVGSLISDDCGAFLAQQVLNHIGLTYTAAQNRSETESHYLRLAKGNPTLNRAVATMKANVEEPLCIDTISKSLNASSRQIQRNFQQHFGETPTSVYRNIRLDHAFKLLRFTDLPIDEISIATGFTSRSQFNLRFRRKFNTTPVHCRAMRYQ